MQAALNGSEELVDVTLVWLGSKLTVLSDDDEVTIDFVSANTSCFGDQVSVWNEELPEDGACLFSGECIFEFEDHEDAMVLFELFRSKLNEFYWAYNDE